jgi:hypothetical protein
MITAPKGALLTLALVQDRRSMMGWTVMSFQRGPLNLQRAQAVRSDDLGGSTEA